MEKSQSPYLIPGPDGKMYKKDSRTWLHKSSLRRSTRALSPSYRLRNPEEFEACLTRLMEDDANVRFAIQEEMFNTGKEADEGHLTAKDSRGLIRSQYTVGNTGKRKKENPLDVSDIASLAHRDRTTDGTDILSFRGCKRARCKNGNGSYPDYKHAADVDTSSGSNDDDDNADDGQIDDHGGEDSIEHRVMRRLDEMPPRVDRDLNMVDALPDFISCHDRLHCRRSAASIHISASYSPHMVHHPAETRSLLGLSPMAASQEDLQTDKDSSSVALSSAKSSPNVLADGSRSRSPDTPSDYQLSQATQSLSLHSTTERRPPNHIIQ